MKLSYLPLVVLLLAPRSSWAQDFSIAAVVNDEVISTLDVDQRLLLAIATSGLSKSEDVHKELRAQVLRGLIAEALQQQEARRLNITVSPDDLEQAIHEMEQQRGRPEGSLLEFLAANGVPKETFMKQVEAQIAWTKLVLKTIKPKVRISEEDIERARQTAPAAAPTLTDATIAVLSLPVERPEQEAEMRRLIEKLAQELKSGAQFEALAQQLGGTAGAIAIVKPFAVTPAQLDPALARAIAATDTGQITPPVRTLSGYTMVKIYDKKTVATEPVLESEMLVKDILLKIKETADDVEVNAMKQVASELGKYPGDCKDNELAGIRDFRDLDIRVEVRRARPSQMTPLLQGILEKLEPGHVSEPVATPEGIRLFLMCERKQVKALPDYEKIKNQLGREKLELEAQKYLQNLRKEAYIEVKE